MKVEAIIFDLDGLLLDTELLQWKGWAETLLHYGVNFSKSEWSKYAGKSARDNAACLIERFLLDTDLQHLLNERSSIFHRLISQGCPQLPYAMEILDYCLSRKIKMAIASNTSRDELTLKIRNSPLSTYSSAFNVIVTKDDVKEGKPSPEIYLKAISILSAAKANCLVLEDSQVGIIAAKSAGIYCCAIPNQFTMNQDFSQAETVCGSLYEVIRLLIKDFS